MVRQAAVEADSGPRDVRYGFEWGGAPPLKMRLKVEINTREHVAVLGYTRRSFSGWVDAGARYGSWGMPRQVGLEVTRRFGAR